MNQVMNSSGTALERTLKRVPYNPAYLHPDELVELDVGAGDTVAITSRYGSVEAVVQPDVSMRRGVVAIPHGWGSLPGRPGPGVNVNLLTSCTTDVEPVNAMPRMSGIPVSVRKVGVGAAAAEGAAAAVPA
jgi:anaerobic selenocysteine-containing dehydrogenase